MVHCGRLIRPNGYWMSSKLAIRLLWVKSPKGIGGAVFNHTEYEDKLIEYLGSISSAISSQKSFSAQVIKVGDFHHASNFPGGCWARTFEILISRESESSDRVFNFVLALDRPIHTYGASILHLNPQNSDGFSQLSYFMHKIARHVDVDVEEQKKFSYMESVYLNGIPAEHLHGANLMNPEKVVSDIDLWVDKAEELLNVAQDLGISAMALVAFLPNKIPVGFFDKIRVEVSQTKKSAEQVLSRWRNN